MSDKPLFTSDFQEIAFDYSEGQLVRLYFGRNETAYMLEDAPREFILEALAFQGFDIRNDSAGYDDEDLRQHVREEFDTAEQDRRDNLAEWSRTGEW